jgi:hypothetical protein
MDPEFLQIVRDNLRTLGYRNISDSLVEEFARRLQDEGTHITSPSRKPPKPKRPKPSIPTSPVPDSAAKPEPVAAPPRKSPKRSPHRSAADELSQWSRRLKAVEAKARGLDSQILECRSAIINPSADEPLGKAIPLYCSTSRRGVDPYPAISRRVSGGGGFIRPPPVRASRKLVGQQPKKGQRLLYEERFPDYVPPPERRRDQLRWRIRQQLEYSDPKYH